MIRIVTAFGVIALWAIALAGCAPAYKPVGQAPGNDAYQKAKAACESDSARLTGMAPAAQQELFDDCMAAQGFVRAN